MIRTMDDFIRHIKFFDNHCNYCLDINKVDESKLPTGEYTVEDKVDGVYCNVVVIAEFADYNVVRCFSRDGKLLSNLQWTERVFSNAPAGVYMCEAWIVNGCFEDASRFFNPNVVNQLDLKPGQRSFLTMFDYVRIDEFIAGKCESPRKTRRKLLAFTWKEFFQGTSVELSYASCHATYAEAVMFSDYRKSSVPALEGTVIRSESGIWKRGERDENTIKDVKYQFYDLRIVGIKIGKGKHANVVGALLVAWKPFAETHRVAVRVPVDGKISYEDRRAWYVMHSMSGNLEGKIAKVRTKGLTSKGLLRQAKLIEIRWDKKEADL